MHVDRRRIFVDWLGWELDLENGRERDRYDDADAVYIVVTDGGDGHLGSVRLLPTERAHLLSDVFPHLCEGDIPRGPAIREITRMCVSPDCAPEDRVVVRRAIATALVRHAYAAGLAGYTAVTDVEFMSRVAAAGWRCRALGLPVRHGLQTIAALMIEIDDASMSELRSAGVYEEGRGLAGPVPVAA